MFDNSDIVFEYQPNYVCEAKTTIRLPTPHTKKRLSIPAAYTGVD